MSFGFKYGVPIDSDLVFDVRFLPNPNFVPDLKAFTGADPDVIEYMNSHEATDSSWITSTRSSIFCCRSTKKKANRTSPSRSAAPAGVIGR